MMNKAEMTKEELIAVYASDLKEFFNHDADMALLTSVTNALGQTIHWADASLISGGQESELDTVKKNFLINKLELDDEQAMDAGIASVLDTYGSSNSNKHRAVVYYMLTKHFNKESVYA
jgi:Protein of unknown function (DUF2853)